MKEIEPCLTGQETREARDVKKEKRVLSKRKRVRCVGGCWLYTAFSALPFCVSMQRAKGKCIMLIFSVKDVECVRLLQQGLEFYNNLPA